VPSLIVSVNDDPNLDPANPGGVPGGSGAPGGAAYTSTSRWLDVRWTYDEPAPTGAATGFEVAIFASATPQTESSWTMLEPVASVPYAAGAGRYSTRASLRISVPLYAAVRVRYGDFRSAWTVLGSPVAFEPDRRDTGADDLPGVRRMEDGTIMQWTTTPACTAEQAYTVQWPEPFPQACLCAVVTTRVDSPGAGNDIVFQLVSKTAAAATVYRQSMSGSGAGQPARAHIVAWGM